MSEIIGLTHEKDCDVFNLRTLLTMQLLTYKDVSVCKLSHMRMCLFATCYKISNEHEAPPQHRARVSLTLTLTLTLTLVISDLTLLYKLSPNPNTQFNYKSNPNPSSHRFVWRDMSYTLKMCHSPFVAAGGTRSRKKTYAYTLL